MLLGHIEISNGDKSETTVQSMLKDILGLGDRLGLVSNLQVEADNKYRLDHPSRARHVHDRGRTAAPSLGHGEHGHAKRDVADNGHLAHAVDRRGKHGIAAKSPPGIAKPNRRVLRNIGLRNDDDVQLMLTQEGVQAGMDVDPRLGHVACGHLNQKHGDSASAFLKSSFACLK